MTSPNPATTAYFAATADGPFDHQRDAFEQGYEEGASHRPCMLCADLRGARAAERQRIRQLAIEHGATYRTTDDADPSPFACEFADLLDGAS